MNILFHTPISLPVDKIRDRFNQELFTFISPSVIPFKHLRFDGCRKGDEIHFEIGLRGANQRWESVITSEGTDERGWSFVDEGKRLPWPLTSWRHHHRVDKVNESQSVIVDDIHYECTPAILAPLLSPVLWSVFAIRPYRYKKFFEG